jgi:hypothetical protein
MAEIFEQGTRQKVRFNETPKGNISIEELWDFPLLSKNAASLDELWKKLNKALKDSNEGSLVVKKSPANKLLKLKFAIVEHIIITKLNEAEARKNALANKSKNEEIRGILADQKLEKLKGMDPKDLQKMIDDSDEEE